MQAAGKILGIDIGATTIKYAVLDESRRLGERQSQHIASASNEIFTEQLVQIIGNPVFADCTAVGIGSPGPLDVDAGIIIASANMPGIRNLNLVADLNRHFPEKKIRLDNDANAATLGEKFFGAGRDLTDFAVFTLGTGVGGGCVYNNKLQRGYKGNFFEVGHVPVALGDRLCGCGNRGCLETYASATGVILTYKEETGTDLDAASIAVRARSGDKAAAHAFALAGEGLGFAAAAITQLMNITHFIFTGGMAAGEDLLRPTLEETWRAHTFSLFHPLAEIIFTQGDENAGIYGAAALFLE